MNTTRPSSHAERDTCIAAAAAIGHAPNVQPVLKLLIELELGPARDAYLAARTTWRVACAAVESASKEAARADVEFDKNFRQWVSTVRDADGKAMPLAVSKLLDGVRPGRLVQMPYREEVNRTTDLLEQVAANPAVAGDPGRLADLQKANVELDRRTTAEENATTVRVKASLALATAQRALDKAWGTIVRKVNDAGPGMATFVPTFVRSSPAPAESDAVGTQAPEVEAPEVEEPAASEPEVEEPDAETIPEPDAPSPEASPV